MFSVSCKILSAIRYESDRLRGLALTLRPAGQAHTMRVRRDVRAWLKRVNFVLANLLHLTASVSRLVMLCVRALMVVAFESFREHGVECGAGDRVIFGE